MSQISSAVTSHGAGDINLDHIAAATHTIDPAFLNSPQYVDEFLSAHLGRRVLVKVETVNPLRSFKGRGADYLVSTLPADVTVVCASGGGNWGQAVAYAARRRGLRSDVFVPAHMSPVKAHRMRAFGATVHVVDGDLHAAASSFTTATAGRVLVTDGGHPAAAEGAGTIGVELLAAEPFDTVIVPVGDGALITGIARWLKDHAPNIQIIGVGSVDAPALVESWRTGDVVTAVPRSTFAAGISITRPHPEAVRRTQALVDDMVLVDNDDIVAAMHAVHETLGVLAEPAGVAGIAALTRHDIPGATVATVITGANIDPGREAG
ncbi:threonine ammonia-lyase [Phytoactinopolyspora limicola]|uniref:threonine ammonia-lyase n=1 Tax=Phytoactinopolyspora limicola TaxID=2715536 RepID=UPI00140B9521|nr:pyridoxal-phosphate dependent enzyme [Phytoactinopolyspora limicola]